MEINTGVVLAAGEGRRLRPLTAHRPKPLLPAGDRSIIQRVFDALIEAGVDDVHVVVGYGRDRVRSAFGGTYRDRSITYHVQSSQLGTGHALAQAAGAVDRPFLVVNGDEVLAPEMVRSVIAGHRPADAATVGVVSDEDAGQFGAVEVDGDRVTAIRERPGEGNHRLMNAGVYVFGPEIFDEIDRTPESAGERELTDTVARQVADGGFVRAVRTEAFWTKVTYPWNLLELATDLTERGITDAPAVEPGVHVAETARVHEDAVLRGPTVIGTDAVVEPGAVVGPGVTLRRNTLVGANATLRRSVIDDDSSVGRAATVADTVTGTGVTIGPGVTIPGGRGDVRIGTTVYERRQLGCVCADRATLGGGATVEPGSLIGPDAAVAPGARIARNVPADTEVR